MTLEADIYVQRRDFTVEASLSLRQGERLSLFGSSGAGKTTILEAIAGAAPLARGEVRVADRLVNAPRRRGCAEPRHCGVSAVRQPTTLFPHLSAAANVAYGTTATAAAEMLSNVGLADLGNARPAGLSGGQRQRVALARALARPFKALLLDEPFSAVDVSARPVLQALAIETAAGQGAISLLVTHDLVEAQSFGHRVAVVADGKILQIADGEKLVRAPASARVALLVGYKTFLDRDSRQTWALHPDRFVPGADSAKGLVIEGKVVAVRAYGARFSCEVLTRDGIHLEVNVDLPPEVGKDWVVTALEPALVARVNSTGEEG